MLQCIRKGKPGARKVARANTLLLADEGHSDREVADALHIGTAAVGRIRKRFVEEGLEAALAERPRLGQRPKVCFDETNKQLVAETRVGLPAQPGQRERYDYEYQRNGSRNLFLFLEPEQGWRHVEVTKRRTMQDLAQQMRWLAEEAYPEAEVVRVVLDNLNTHRPASLYETFAPAEARRILKRLEFHYTPKHGSWLSMAEMKLSLFSRECLGRRIPDEATLKGEVQALEEERNQARARVNWRFTARDARSKLNHLYPSISN